LLAALGVVSSSCIDTSGLAGGPPLADGSTVTDTGPANPDPCGKDLQTDLGNCGSCGNVCGFGANSFPLCTAGKCTIGCNTQFGNCDGNDTNGCEVSLAADPANCNACGRDCGGGTCTAGQCGAVNLAPKVDAGLDDGYPISLAIDATSIFFGWYSSTNAMYDLVKLDKTSGVAVILATGTMFSTSYIAVDADPNGFIYLPRPLTMYFGQVAPSTNPTSADGAILKVAKTSPGGVLQTPIIVAGSDQGAPGGLFVDGNTHVTVTSDGIYFSEYGVDYYSVINGGVFKCPLTAPPCSPEQLAPNEYGIYGMALDGAGFAFDNVQSDTAFTCPLVGCPATPTTLQTSVQARVMLVDAANYYWIDQSNNSIVEVNRTTSTLTSLATGQISPYWVAIDDKNVYWVSSGSPGTLSACAIAGCAGAPTVLVPNLTQAREVVADTTAIYWISSTTGGSVYKVIK
jgi:hypothetical protein